MQGIYYTEKLTIWWVYQIIADGIYKDVDAPQGYNEIQFVCPMCFHFV